MTFKKRQNTFFSALKFLPMDRNLHQWNQSLALPVAENSCNAGRSTPPKDIKAILFMQIWTFSQIACFMSPLWDQTLPGRTPVAPTEKPLCTLLLYDQRALLHNQPAAQNLLQDECPLPFNDVPLGQRTSFHLPQACCFMLDIIFGAFQLLCHEKKNNCKLFPLPLSVLFVIHTTFQQTSLSSMLSPFNLSLYRSCYTSCNSVFVSFTDSVPFPQFPLRQGTWSCTQSADDVPGLMQQHGTVFYLIFFAYNSSQCIFGCSWAYCGGRTRRDWNTITSSQKHLAFNFALMSTLYQGP